MISKIIPGFWWFSGEQGEERKGYTSWVRHAEAVKTLVNRLNKTKTPPARYDLAMAELCAFMSTWIYADESTIEAALDEIGVDLDDWSFFATNNGALFIDTQAMIVRLPLAGGKSLGIVAFRGTEPNDFIDLLTDINTKPVEFLGGKVHKGFLDALFPILAMIENDLVAHPVDYLYWTGHSLGGALTVLGAAHALVEKPTVIDHKQLCGVYTYGQPMVGDKDFPSQKYGGSLFAKKVYRHVYLNDLVPRLPPQSVDRYVHIGTEYRVDPDTGCWVQQESPTAQSGTVLPNVAVGFADFLLRRFIVGRGRNFLLDAISNKLGSIDDHLPDAYNRISIQSAMPLMGESQTDDSP